MKKNDGGPAFPCLEARNAPNEGMSLRDYFAGQALSGLLVKFSYGGLPDSSLTQAEVGAAIAAYRMADAMLAEREKGQ